MAVPGLGAPRLAGEPAGRGLEHIGQRHRPMPATAPVSLLRAAPGILRVPPGRPRARAGPHAKPLQGKKMAALPAVVHRVRLGAAEHLGPCPILDLAKSSGSRCGTGVSVLRNYASAISSNLTNHSSTTRLEVSIVVCVSGAPHRTLSAIAASWRISLRVT